MMTRGGSLNKEYCGLRSKDTPAHCRTVTPQALAQWSGLSSNSCGAKKSSTASRIGPAWLHKAHKNQVNSRIRSMTTSGLFFTAFDHVLAPQSGRGGTNACLVLAASSARNVLKELNLTFFARSRTGTRHRHPPSASYGRQGEHTTRHIPPFRFTL